MTVASAATSKKMSCAVIARTCGIGLSSLSGFLHTIFFRESFFKKTFLGFSICFLVGNAIDFHFAIDHHAGDHTGARRRMLPEVLPEYCVERLEIPRIVEPDAATHDVLWRVARFFQDREQVSDRLVRLCHDVSNNN